MTLFQSISGPRMRYANSRLYIDDMQMHGQWRISRGQLWVLGWRCLLAALRG